MDTFVDERDDKLLEADRYTFAVLRRIMKGECRILLSDHERFILCFTGHPFPVWIWLPDDASSEEMESAFQVAKEKGLLNGEYHFNVKYDLAKYFMNRAEKEGVKLSIITNMFAYDCPALIEPKNACGGSIHCCTMDDLEELVAFMDLFHQDIGIDQGTLEDYRKGAIEFINQGTMYFWKDEAGNSVGCCKYAPAAGGLASINLVFTHPDHRRKHYAENLVYQVTKKAQDAGYLPMLYTDADYVASNACYEKIGYILRGKLCSIG